MRPSTQVLSFRLSMLKMAPQQSELAVTCYKTLSASICYAWYQFWLQSWPKFWPGFKNWPGQKFGLLRNVWFQIKNIFSLQTVDIFHWLYMIIHVLTIHAAKKYWSRVQMYIIIILINFYQSFIHSIW